MRCKEVRKSLSAYVDQLLSEAKSQAIWVHLAGCRPCQSELELTHKLIHTLRDDPVPEVPELLWQRIEKSITRQSAQVLPRRYPFLRAAVVLLAISLGLVLWWLQPAETPFEVIHIGWDSFSQKWELFGDANYLREAPGSDYRIVEPDLILLDRGKLWLDIARKDKARLQVKTPAGDVIVRGTEFVVQVLGGLVGVFVISGAVELKNDAGSKIADAGEFVWAQAGRRPQKMRSEQKVPKLRPPIKGPALLIWGGTAGAGHYLDGAIYDLSTGRSYRLPDPPIKQRLSSAILLKGRNLMIWGGEDVSDSKGAIFDLDSWGWKPMPEAPIDVRVDHTMLQTGTKVIIWGGRAGKDTYYNDGAIYDIASREWSEISEAPVDPRCAHTSFLLGSKLVIWGGDGEEGPYNDGAIYDLSTGKWQKIAKSPLGPRLAHVSILSGSKLLIWGGAGEDEYYDDGAIYDISADKWRKISSSPLSARSGHTAILCGSKVIVWGGVCEKRWGGMLKKVHCTDGAVYDLATDRWQKLPDSPLKGRWGLTPILYNKRLIMWGGVNKERDYNDGAIYEISRGVWEGIPEAPVGGRYNCELALSGSRLVVWGGVPKTQWYQTWYADGATYDMETGEWEELEEAPIEGRDPCTFFVLKLRSGLQQKAEGHDPRCPWEQECEGCRKRVKRSIKAILRDQEASGEWKGNHGGTDLTQLLTSISGLALISTGSTHKEGRYKTEISKALEAVLKGIKRAEAGAFHRGFQRSFVLLFLSEVYMRDPDERIKRAASILIKRLRRSQLRNGGWGYDPDISSFRYDHFAATAAILIALCVAKDAGFDVPAGMIKKAIRYVERCANKDGSFTYTLTPVLPGGRRIIRQGESPDRCGTAVCALLFAKPDSKKIKPGLRYFIDNLDRVILNKVRPEGGLFNRFFNSVMMYKLGGAMGKKWEKQLREKGVTGGFGGFEAQVELISLVLYRGGLKIFAKR